MIEKLRFMIDQTDNPKLLSILVKVAQLPEDKQEGALKMMEIIIRLKRSD